MITFHRTIRGNQSVAVLEQPISFSSNTVGHQELTECMPYCIIPLHLTLFDVEWLTQLTRHYKKRSSFFYSYIESQYLKKQKIAVSKILYSIFMQSDKTPLHYCNFSL